MKRTILSLLVLTATLMAGCANNISEEAEPAVTAEAIAAEPAELPEETPEAEETAEPVETQAPEEESDAELPEISFDAEDMPSNFRTAASPWLDSVVEEIGADAASGVSREGLNDLRISGSGQPSADEIAALREVLPGEVYVVDLRDEEHDCDGESEESVVQAAGMQYVAFPVRDHYFPDAETVDEFIAFYQSLPEDVWLHFHCKAGKGRTTTFMLMTDIMENNEIDYDTLALRQYLLGDSNLNDDNESSASKRERAEMLRLFYRYVNEQKESGYSVPWSEWFTTEAE